MNAPLRVPPALLRELGKIAAESKRDISDLAEAEIVRRRRNAA